MNFHRLLAILAVMDNAPRQLTDVPDELLLKILRSVPQALWASPSAACALWHVLLDADRDEFCLLPHYTETPARARLALLAARRTSRAVTKLSLSGVPVATLAALNAADEVAALATAGEVGPARLTTLECIVSSAILEELVLVGRTGRPPQPSSTLSSTLLALAAAPRPALRRLDLSWTDAVDASSLGAALSAAAGLTALRLAACSRVSLSFVREHVLHLAPQLLELSLSACENLSNTAVCELCGSCRALRTLELSDLPINQQTLLVALNPWLRLSLRRLVMSGHSRLPAECFGHALTMCPYLTDIDFSASACNDDALRIALSRDRVTGDDTLSTSTGWVGGGALGAGVPGAAAAQAGPPQAFPLLLAAGGFAGLDLDMMGPHPALEPQPPPPPPPPADAKCVLQHVALRDCSGVSEIGLSALLRSSGDALRKLQLGGVFSPATDACAQLLGGGIDGIGLASLRELALPCCKLSVQGCEALRPLCEQLAALDLSHSATPEEGLAMLLPRYGIGCGARLRRLSLRGCGGVTDRLLGAFWPRALGLRTLDVAGCTRLTDTFITVLLASWSDRAAARRPCLRWLDISGCEGIGGFGHTMLRKLTKTVQPLKIAGLDVGTVEIE